MNVLKTSEHKYSYSFFQRHRFHISELCELSGDATFEVFPMNTILCSWDHQHQGYRTRILIDFSHVSVAKYFRAYFSSRSKWQNNMILSINISDRSLSLWSCHIYNGSACPRNLLCLYKREPAILKPAEIQQKCPHFCDSTVITIPAAWCFIVQASYSLSINVHIHILISKVVDARFKHIAI